MEISNFTNMAQHLARLAEHSAFAHDDVGAWGAPSECHLDVHRNILSRALGIKEELGMGVKEFSEEAERRGINARWLHFSPVGYGLELLAEAEETLG